MPTALLDGRFVRCVVAGEEGLLRFAGVPQLIRSRFYREHVFPRLPELTSGARDEVMLMALHELHALSGEDSGFTEALKDLAFVPVGSGALRCASELFHPRVSEAAELLERLETRKSSKLYKVHPDINSPPRTAVAMRVVARLN